MLINYRHLRNFNVFSSYQLKLYPTVGLQTPGEIVDANFGQTPFVYDIYEEFKVSR